MRCTHCNSHIESTDKYCTGCGVDQTLEQRSTGIKSLFRGSWKYYKNNRIKTYLTSLIIVVIALVTFFVSLSSSLRYDSKIYIIGSLLVLLNTLPYIFVKHGKEISFRHLSALLNSFAALYLIFFLISFVQKAAIDMEAFQFFVLPIYKYILILLCIPIFTFAIFYRIQFDISYASALGKSFSLILDNLTQIMFMLIVLTLITVISFFAFILPALFLLPFISYAWAFYHRVGQDVSTTTDLTAID